MANASEFFSGFPAGGMVFFGGASAPAGWLLCYGQAVSRTTYAALFAAIGTAHGSGDGSTTFNLPDMRGRAPVGLDDMGGASANRVPTGTDNGEFGASPGLGSTGGLSRIQFVASGSNASVGSSRVFLLDVDSNSSDGTTAGSQDVGHVAHQPSLLANWIIKT